MIPVPEVDEPVQAANDFLPFNAALVARAPRLARSQVAGLVAAHLPVDEQGIGALLRFKSMMAHEGLTVHLARLCYDKLYAYDRIAAAHASADETLRRLALELFQIYHWRQAAAPH